VRGHIGGTRNALVWTAFCAGGRWVGFYSHSIVAGRRRVANLSFADAPATGRSFEHVIGGLYVTQRSHITVAPPTPTTTPANSRTAEHCFPLLSYITRMSSSRMSGLTHQMDLRAGPRMFVLTRIQGRVLGHQRAFQFHRYNGYTRHPAEPRRTHVQGAE
jgi:hypothetical protein